MSERISKSEQKRRFKRVEDVAAELAVLRDGELQSLPASEEIKKEIRDCRGVTGGAKKRQIKYLAKCIREDEEAVVALLDFLALRKGSKLKKKALQHEAERLRDLLVDEALNCQQEMLQVRGDFSPDLLEKRIEDGALASLIVRFKLDRKELSRLLYQYAQSRVHNYYREIFRVVKAGLEYEERTASVQHP